MVYESLILLLPNCRFMVQLHQLAHAQFVGKVHRSETKFEKGASDRNSRTVVSRKRAQYQIYAHPPLLLQFPAKVKSSLQKAPTQLTSCGSFRMQHDAKGSRQEHANADGLSWLPLPCEKPECLSMSADAAFVIGQVQALPVTAA